MKTYNKFINESIRDKMLPKSGEDLTGASKDFLNAYNYIKSLDFKTSVIYDFEDKYVFYIMNNNILIRIAYNKNLDIKWFAKICDSEAEETNLSITHKGISYHFVKAIVPENKSEDNWEFILKNITPYLKNNESIRDKMTPKSEEEIESVIKNILNRSIRLDKCNGELDEYNGKLEPVFKEISKLTNKPLDELYFLDDVDDVYEIYNFFGDYLGYSDFIKPIKVKQPEIPNNIHGQWYCLPHQDFAWWGYGSDRVIGWVFHEKML
jgi:hypothetical protein